jgi:hypothetical protein
MVKENHDKYLTLFQKQFNSAILIDYCEIIRCGLQIPSIIFFSNKSFNLLTFAKFNEDKTDIQLLDHRQVPAAFCESVFLGHFGQTSIFFHHIVIQVPISSLIFARSSIGQGCEIWSLQSGHFLLRFENNELVPHFQNWTQFALSQFPDMSYLMNITSFPSAVACWNNSQISNTELILWVNAFERRSFADQSRLPVFPVSSFTTDSFPPPATSCPGSHGYFATKIGDRQTVIDFVQKIRRDLDMDGFTDENLHIGDLDVTQVSQQLRIKVGRNKRVKFHQNQIVLSHRLERLISMSPFATVRVWRHQSAIICRNRTKLFFSVFDHLLAFVNSITVSDNKCFLVLDFVFGLTRIYRILYKNFAPAELQQLSDISWLVTPTTVISGFHLIAATLMKRVLVLWDAITGSIHSKIEFEDVIDFVAMDEEVGIWVIAKGSITLLSINGELLAKIVTAAKVTAIAVLLLKEDAVDRAAICGTEDGKVFVVSARTDTHEIDCKELPSEHRAAIVDVVIHSSLKSFLTVDANGVVLIWTGIDLGFQQRMKFETFASCPFCANAPSAFCSACNRAVCNRCKRTHRLSVFCVLCICRAFC